MRDPLLATPCHPRSNHAQGLFYKYFSKTICKWQLLTQLLTNAESVLTLVSFQTLFLVLYHILSHPVLYQKWKTPSRLPLNIMFWILRIYLDFIEAAKLKCGILVNGRPDVFTVVTILYLLKFVYIKIVLIYLLKSPRFTLNCPAIHELICLYQTIVKQIIN